MTIKEQSNIRRKLRVLQHGKNNGNISKTCRFFGISGETYYQWKRNYEQKGEVGLIHNKPCPQNQKLWIAAEIEEKILYLRKTYHLGQMRISWYLKRYHDIKVSASCIWYVLKRNGLNRLPQNQRKRSMKQFKRYEKQVPGHRIQIDVKFLSFTDKQSGKEIKRYQYTAIDDATRARALNIFDKHNQQCIIKFVDYVFSRFPFRIHTIQTDNGHEFQALFHWHCEDWVSDMFILENTSMAKYKDLILQNSASFTNYWNIRTILISQRNWKSGKYFIIQSQSYFSKTFKSVYGKTPSEYFQNIF